MECVKLIKKSNAILLGFACLIDRSNMQSLKIKRKMEKVKHENSYKILSAHGKS